MNRKLLKDPNDLRLGTFAMRINFEERQMLMDLARHLQRTQSDAVRLLVREASRGLCTAKSQVDPHGPRDHESQRVPRE